jgi:hypothetical protein
VKKREYMIIDSNELGREIGLPDLISKHEKEKVEKYINQIGSEG